jgi:putative peptidoglycan lipid II flippase
LLNVVWIGGIWCVAPLFESQTAQVYAICGSILFGGCLQLAVPWWKLRQFGYRRDPAWRDARQRVIEIGRTMLPVVLGLSVTQLNVLADSLIAWGFSQSAGGPGQMNLPGSPEYPLSTGTASALYFGQRMYQFPLGVFGVALGTVLFPLLSRHAERGRLDLLRNDLSLGMRLVIGIGLPASLGLVLMARPLTVLLFQHGQFDAADTVQTAEMISTYGIAVWAYCGLLIVHRGYYAAGDRQTPLRVGMFAVALNLVLNFTLIWPLGGRGLALGTALSSMAQVAAVTWLLQSRLGRFDWKRIRGTLLKAGFATCVMGAACYALLGLTSSVGGFRGQLLAVFVPLLTSVAIYFLIARLIGLDDVWLLFRRDTLTADQGDDAEV